MDGPTDKSPGPFFDGPPDKSCGLRTPDPGPFFGPADSGRRTGQMSYFMTFGHRGDSRKEDKSAHEKDESELSKKNFSFLSKAESS